MNVYTTYENGRIIMITESEGTVEYFTRVSLVERTIQYRALAFVHPDGYAVISDAVIENGDAARINDMVIFTDEQMALKAALAHVRDCRTFISGNS